MPLDSIFSNVVEGTQEGAAQECELRKPDLELHLQARIIKLLLSIEKLWKTIQKMCKCVL